MNDNIKEEKVIKKKNVLILGLIFSFIFICLGGTYAYWVWESETTEVTFTVTKDFECSVDGGGSMTADSRVSLLPTSCTDSEHAIMRELTVTANLYDDRTVLMNLWIEIDDLGVGLAGTTNFKYALTTSNTSCSTDVVRTGNFKDLSAGDTAPLFNYMAFNESAVDTYYLWIWLDEAETSTASANQTFDLSLNGICTDAPEPETYMVYDETDGALSIYKRDETTPISNNNTNNVVINMNDMRYNDLSNEVDTISDDAVYISLENVTFSSPSQLPWYEYRDSITSIVIEDEISPISTRYWFSGLKNVEYIDVSKLDTSKVTTMINMFSSAGYNASSFEIVGLDKWNTSNVTNMGSMFSSAGYNATTWSIGDLSGWDVSNVTSMMNIFRETGKNSTIWDVGDISKWDVSGVTGVGMSNMFNSAGYNATKFNLDLSDWDVSNVTNMNSIFRDAGYNATTWSIGDISGWDVSNVTSMEYMFDGAGYSASTWNVGDISKWDVSKVTTMYYMFYSAGYNATKFNLDLSNWDVSGVIGNGMSSMFYYAGYKSTIFDLDLSDWDVSGVTSMSSMFRYAGRNATSFSVGDISEWDTSNVTNMNYMFDGAGRNAAYILDLSDWNVSKVTSYSGFNLNVTTKVIAPTWAS